MGRQLCAASATIRNTSDCLHHYHWTVLFDSKSCTLYVKSNEHCSLDLEAETSVWQCRTAILTEQL